MNSFNRLLLVLIGVVGLISAGLLALTVYDVPNLSNWLQTWQQQEWFYYTVLAISAFLAVVFLILLCTGLFTSSPDRELIIVTSEGKITISKATIESTTLKAIQSVQGIRSPKVEALINPRKEYVSVLVSCSLFGREGLPSIGKDMQAEIKRAVESLLELPVHSVRIHLTDTKTQTKERVV